MRVKVDNEFGVDSAAEPFRYAKGRLGNCQNPSQATPEGRRDCSARQATHWPRVALRYPQLPRLH